MLASPVRFAVIGDYGESSRPEIDVARQIRGWKPNFIITVGDNNYPSGAASSVDRNIGRAYHQFIYPYAGAYGSGPDDGLNHFFPALGNHDWQTRGARPYLQYFHLPGNERYYTFTQGPVQFFVLDSDPHEPDLGFVKASRSTANSIEGQWLKSQLAKSQAQWKIVYFHHPPYSSGTIHGSSAWMQWPFKKWGANAILSGHEHNYERIIRDGLPYFVDGLGGNTEIYDTFRRPVAGSKIRYAGDFGAMRIDATDTSISFRFVARSGKVIDRYTMKTPT